MSTARRGGTVGPARIAVVVAGLLVGGLAALALGPAPAGAHAAVASTSPGDGTQVTAAPERVEMVFNENVSAGLGAVRVLDTEGRRVDTGQVDASGRRLVVPLRGGLADGAYVVAWRVVSADSHPIRGAFTFVVGDGEVPDRDTLIAALVGDGDDGTWRVAGTVTRVAGYGGVLLAAGLAVFLVAAHDGGAERDRLRRLLRRAGAVGAVGLLAELPVRAALATGLGPRSLTEDGVLGQLLADHVGVTLAVVLAATALVALDGGRDRLVVGAGALAVGIGFGLSGHTATTSPWAVAVVGDAAHVVAGAVWFGGVVGCLAVLRARRRSGQPSAAVVARFSGLAGGVLAVVAVAGVALGWTQVRTVDALVTTPYGQLLMAKVAIVAAVALAGGWNRYRLVPFLGRDDVDQGQITLHLRRTVAAEVALLVALVGVTAVLVDVTPARASVVAPYSTSADLGQGRADVVVDPARAGPTTMHVYLLDGDGNPLAVPEGVTVRLSLPTADLGPIERRPMATGPGHWTLIGNDFSIPGDWEVEVVARVSLYDQETARVEVPIGR